MTTSIVPQESPALLDVRAVARLLDCSPRHVYRMADAGILPRPVKVGALVRWPRQAIADWIAGGCKPVQDTADEQRSSRSKTGGERPTT